MIHDGRRKVEVVNVILEGISGGHPPPWQGAGRSLVGEGVPGGQRHLRESWHK